MGYCKVRWAVFKVGKKRTLELGWMIFVGCYVLLQSTNIAMGHQALDPHEHEGTHLVWVRIRPSRGRVARIFKSWETWRLERAKKVQPARQANTVCEERVHFSLAREESDVGCKVLVSRSIQDGIWWCLGWGGTLSNIDSKSNQTKCCLRSEKPLVLSWPLATRASWWCPWPSIALSLYSLNVFTRPVYKTSPEERSDEGNG